MPELFLAAFIWVATHLGISSSRIRQRLVGLLGESAYLGLYSLVAAAALTFLIVAWAQAPRDIWLWLPASWQVWWSLLVMVPAMVLLVVGVLSPNPTSVGQDAQLSRADAARGVLRITRHPVQWSFLLWVIAHLPANGDLATLVLLLAIALVAAAGPLLIDRRKARSHPDGWAQFSRVTSNLPFAAIIRGDNRLVVRELGWYRVLLALAIYLLVIASHRWIAGVPIPI